MNEAETVLSYLYNCRRTDLYLRRHDKLGKDKAAILCGIFKRRLKGEPLGYLLGQTEFMGLNFKITADVLLPRQDTEILVETALEKIKSLKKEIKVLDIGTGSGCVAISLVKFIPHIKVTATDISLKAIELAKQNAVLNLVKEKIEFICCDLFPGHPSPVTSDQNFDVIVSNPPYIPSKEINLLQEEVQHEPRIALDGGKDGLDYYRRIIKEAPRFLKDNGHLLFEIGIGQAAGVRKITEDSGNFMVEEVVRDYSGIERVLILKNLGTLLKPIGDLSLA